ncbi:uncharacterized protein LOC132839857 isoform X1 [Tachysurus vachellii]|uniref:uncharacterized protein LOC132839857 isoform X1 n=1 Tax=Tachysurus vachellii TaxID=175792 RepID=UPI00296B13E1|nr:uncharacterized protein LOC132839857 isoform X1 [Tachysurus vachellii]
MSCQLQSRITAILILTSSLSLFLTTHGSVFDRTQSVRIDRKLQKESKPRGEDQVNSEITEQQSVAANSETQSRWSSQNRHAIVDETENFNRYTSSSAIRQSDDTYMLTSKQGGKDLFLSNSPGFDGQAVQGKVNLSSTLITEEWLQMRPQVQCSPAAIILTAKGWNYVHLLVDRVGASPVSLLHLPSHCKYNVRATWRDLVLIAPYDGCYVLQQNGSYVLPLLWWGMPLSISCPMTLSSAPATPSGFCSNQGITLMIDRSLRSIGRYSIKVNEEWVPLVSGTCAYLLDSATVNLILFIPFTVQCATDGGSNLNILLDEKMYTLSCQPHYYLPYYPQYNPSAPYFRIIPLDPSLTKQAIPKPHMVPEITNLEHPQQHILLSSEQSPDATTGETIQHPQHPSLGSYDVSHVPIQVRSSEIPTTRSTKIKISPFQPPSGNLQLSMPMVYPPYQHFAHPVYPYYHNFHNQKLIPPHSHIPKHKQALNQTPKPQMGLWPQTGAWLQMLQLPHVPQNPQPQPLQMLQLTQMPQLPQVPQMPQLPQVPQMPQLPQVPQVPQLPQVPQKPQLPQVPQKPQLPQVPQMPQHPILPVLANDSSQLLPALTCKGDHLRASLPSTKINSVKVKDVKRKVWVPVSSTPAHCRYSLQPKGKSVVFSSPLPACHSYTLSPLLLSLSLKFWDSAISKHRALRLQCPYNSTSPTMTDSFTTIQPSQPQKLLGMYFKPSKPEDSHLQRQNSSVPFLAKPTAASFQMSKDTKPTSWPSKLTWTTQSTPLASLMHQPQVSCHSKDMSVTFPPGPISGLTVKSPVVGIKGGIKEVLFDEAPSHCGYLIKKNQDGGINIILPYTSCHMAHQNGEYRILLKYHTADGHRNEASLSCQVPMNHECSLLSEQRLPCGPSSVSASECRNLGCCYIPDSQTCYYPMDECTSDRHFVFSVPASLTEPPLSPALLAAAGNRSCTPQRVVADTALFKIPLDDCGAHRYEVGNTVIYMLEILNTLHSVTLNYGTITRDSPFRLLVECRYLPGTVASVGYLVKSPSLGPSIQAQGVFGVQLRIAKDQQYSSYYPQYHRPLRKLLGKPLYLEVRLLNPLDPSMVLLVHYCVAYPRSAHSAWVLIYDGCPNPLDVTPSHEPPAAPPEGLANNVRRFTVSTFQFLENSRKEMTAGGEEEGEEEEVYFMCATEVCLPSEGPCVEGCIGHSPSVKS